MIGKTNGTMIEAMLKNGSVSSMFAPLSVERIKEVINKSSHSNNLNLALSAYWCTFQVHQAQREQSPLGLEEAVAPFPHEEEIMGGTADAPSAETAAEEPPAA